MPIFSYTYSLPYLLLFVFYAVYGMISSKCRIKKHELLICSFVFLIFFGGRGFISFDWSNYYLIFKDILPIFPFENIEKNQSIVFTEPLFRLYVSFIKLFTDNYLVYQLISCLIDVSCFAWFLKRYSTSYAFSFAFFLAFSFGLEVDVQRNVKALLLLLWAVKYIDEEKPLKFYLLNIIAIFFHASAIFFLPCYFVGRCKFPKKLYIFLCLILIVYYSLQLHVFSSFALDYFSDLLGGTYAMKVDDYSGTESSVSKGFSIGAVERIVSIALVCMYYQTLLQRLPKIRVILNIFLYSMIFHFFFYDFSIISTRVGLLFSFVYWIIWPALLHVCKVNHRLILLFMLCYCLLKISARTGNILHRYDNLLFGGDSYETRISVFNKFPD